MDFPIAVRLGASDYLPGGTTIEDSVIAAKAFEEAGVCLIDVSGGFSFYTHPYTKKEGYFCDLSEVLKKSVHIPVILTGGVVTASAAEDLLVSNKADMIGVGRAILKDSNWASEALAALE
jgi:2,4-dienoyl-CoA reductase-like NADH-dependent reductase (Old Yellow Enzyme family)